MVRLLALVAIATSSALLVDYLSYSPAFCSPNSGCSAVRASGFGYLFGGTLPVPVIGIAGFGLLYFISLSKAQRAWTRPMAYAGGAIAAGFIAIQAVVIKEYCALCMIVDVAAILAAGAAHLSREKTARDRDDELLAGWAWIGLAGLAIAAPLVWPKLQPKAPVPDGIRQYYKAGKINVVEFADYECPFCRALHPTLKKLVGEYGDRVNFVRLNMPLTRHERARDAAKAVVCASAQGREEAMADALFESEDLSPPTLRRIAVGLGVEPKKFDDCLVDPKTNERITRESQILRAAGFQGLPTTYVGASQIVGARGEDVFREAFEQAARGDTGTAIPGWAYLGLIGLLAGALAHFGKLPSAEVPAKGTEARREDEDDDARDDDDENDGDDDEAEDQAEDTPDDDTSDHEDAAPESDD